MNDPISREEKRLSALKETNILDTLPEQEYDDIALLASQICETPIALITLVDKDRQWFKSRVGSTDIENPRETGFCDRVIEGTELVIIPDARKETRFAENPYVQTDPGVIFYAGAPLITPDGYSLGTLCVVDHKPRKLSANQKRALTALARSTMSLLDARRSSVNATRAELNAITSISGHNGFLFQEDVKFGHVSFFSRIKPYLLATFIVLFAFAIKGFLIDPLIQIESPFLLFFVAILLSAWRGGAGAGAYATGLAALLVTYFFMKPTGDLLGHSAGQNIRIAIFLCEGILTSYLCQMRLHSEGMVQESQDQLENSVRHRTAELARANLDLKEEIHDRTILQRELRDARDAAIESAKMKSEFLANMSHEIRTPMNGIIGMTGLLMDTKLDDEQKRFAEIIRNCGDSLMAIINDILDLSKIEAGKLDLETLDFNLRDLVESTVEIFSDRARDNKNELATLLYADVPLGVRGDPGRIRQVLTNFISNAVKFTRKGDVIVRVKKQTEANGKAVLCFSVSDTGVGIPENIREKLFQPFTQSDASTTREYGGTGLGLSISKRLVEIMGGEIGVESVQGKGSTFWFTLEIEIQERRSVVGTRSDGLELPLSGRRVLIVDDNTVNREILAYQVRSWAMEVYEADGPAEGLDRLKAMNAAGAPVELVIMDLQMPGIDGLATTRLMREWADGCDGTPSMPPVIMISSGGRPVSREELREIGIDTFLTKPYRQDDLLTAVRRAFGLLTEPVFDPFRGAAEIDEETRFFAEDSKKVLLVEDNLVNQMVAGAQLKKFGYRVTTAVNGLQALKTLESDHFDLILMDCQMPEMDGYEATRQIRARDWQAARIPVIALTAHAIDGEREKCLRAGMNDYISKPVEKEELQRIIGKWLETGVDGDPDINYTPDRGATSPATVFSAVDIAILDDITGGDEVLKKEVIVMYLEQTVEQLSDIESAISAGDSELLYNAAHKNLGGSAMCGMTGLVAPMKTLEAMGRDRQHEAAAPVLEQARLAFEIINTECRALLGERMQ
jgi:signal transduction histidine kinase/DNA-binding response OmpR family regulator/HPt (histidine-containing phosphotransfer) domain-containing protein